MSSLLFQWMKKKLVVGLMVWMVFVGSWWSEGSSSSGCLMILFTQGFLLDGPTTTTIRSRKATTFYYATTIGNNKLRRQGQRRQKHASSSSSSSSGLLLLHADAGFRGTTTTTSDTQWEVYVDQSKSALDKGAAATLDAFLHLAPPHSGVTVRPCLLRQQQRGGSSGSGSNKKKSRIKGPAVRCLNPYKSFDVSECDSVDKVFRVLTRHMNVKDVSTRTVECLKWKYRGNGHLEAGKVSLAIDCYDKALLACENPTGEGILLLMRSEAYLKRAAAHRDRLQSIVNQLSDMVPNDDDLHFAYQQAAAAAAAASSSTTSSDATTTTNNSHHSFSNAIFRRVLQATDLQEAQFRQTQYRHGLYQYALLQAAQDSLRATRLLPDYADAWKRAGDILSELWKLKESAQYYIRAKELLDEQQRNVSSSSSNNKNKQNNLSLLIDRLQKRQALLDSARAYGWSEDTLRLALDVAR